MADLVTMSGGAHHGISSLTAAEHQAAINALSKLTAGSGATHGVAAALTGSLRSATLSGGTVHPQESIKLSSPSTPSFGSIGSDTVVAGSAFSASHTTTGKAASVTAHPLSGDTINVAGTTAASVKSETVLDTKAAHTITLSDKTTITLTGVAPHDVTKPH